MITDKLFKMIHRDRPAHQVSQALRDLDRAMLVATVDEQQEAVTLAKARGTVLADRAQFPAALRTSTSRSKPTTRGNHRSRSLASAIAVFMVQGAGVALVVVFQPSLLVPLLAVAAWLYLAPLLALGTAYLVLGAEYSRWAGGEKVLDRLLTTLRLRDVSTQTRPHGRFKIYSFGFGRVWGARE